MQNKRQVGGYGEDLAVAYLEKHGYNIVSRNVRMRSGEIDIIATHRGATVFVEVKYRRGTQFGNPEESVTAQKIQCLRGAITEWCAVNHCRGTVRADVVAITDLNGAVSYDIFEDILTS
ncbi:MAG: YraN family protein [bacterium]|nr:YraN family protein [bacterium]